MNLCSDGHDEICYEGRSCPLCAFKEVFESLRDENIELEEKNIGFSDALSEKIEEIEEMRQRIETLEKDIDGLINSNPNN